MKTIKVNTAYLIAKLLEIKNSGNDTVHISIVEGNPKKHIPAHIDIDGKNDFRCVLEVKK